MRGDSIQAPYVLKGPIKSHSFLAWVEQALMLRKNAGGLVAAAPLLGPVFVAWMRPVYYRLAEARLETLRAEIKNVSKRLRVLDKLTEHAAKLSAGRRCPQHQLRELEKHAWPNLGRWW